MSTFEEIMASAPEALRERRVLRRRALRVLRPPRTPAAAVVAAVLTGMGAAIAADVISALAGSPLGLLPWPTLNGLTWADRSVIITAALAVAGGLILLVLGLAPGRARLVPVETTDPALVIGVTRTGLRRTLAAAACGVDGIERARIRLRRRRVEVTVVSSQAQTGGLVAGVRIAVGERLNEVGALYGREVAVRLRRRQV